MRPVCATCVQAAFKHHHPAAAELGMPTYSTPVRHCSTAEISPEMVGQGDTVGSTAA